MSYNISDVLPLLVPDAKWVVHDTTIVEWNSPDILQPTEEEINSKIAELEAAEPMRRLRIERDRLIALTDWRFRSDLSPSQAWIDYCQSLRDLPATADPQLDERGNLVNVTWPEVPE